MFNLIGRVFSVFKAPSFGVINRALRGLIVIRFWFMIGSRSMVSNWGMVDNWGVVDYRGVVDSMVDWGNRVVDKSSWVVSHWSFMVDGFRFMIRLRGGMVDGGGVVHRFNWTISWSRGVAINYRMIIGFNCCHCHAGEDL